MTFILLIPVFFAIITIAETVLQLPIDFLTRTVFSVVLAGVVAYSFER